MDSIADIVDDPTAAESREASWLGGYYPTQEDLLYQGHYDYPRSRGDAWVPTRSGFAPYVEPREKESYKGIIHDSADAFSRFFAPHEALVYQHGNLDEFSATLDGEWDPFMRAYNPGRTHLKAGPFYFDLLHVGAGVVWSDYSGTQSFPDGEEDGWIGYVELGMQASLRITDDLYLRGSANLIYLPWENEIGFGASTGFGADGPSLLAGFRYEKDLGSWSLALYDTWRTNVGFFDLNAEDGSAAVDRAGRYSFGFQGGDGVTNNYFEGDDIYHSNTVGASASSLVFTKDWRFWASAAHTDAWRDTDFVDHSYRDSGRVLLGYEGHVLPFAPAVGYEISSDDGFDSYNNHGFLQLRGRLTENIQADGSVGYQWTNGEHPDHETLAWDFGLSHAMTEATRHYVRAGQGIQSNDLIAEEAYATYVNYGLEHRVSSRSSVSLNVQYSEDEALQVDKPLTERITVWSEIDYRLWTHTRLSLRGAYEETQPEAGEDTERWLVRAGFSHWLASRLSLNGFYQFEDQQGDSTVGFDEHAVGLGLRRYF